MLIEIGLLIFVYMVIAFLIGFFTKDNSVADVFWGVGFVLISCFTLFRTGAYEFTQLLMTGLVAIWGLRLFLHIFKRKWKKPEDYRYAHWRKEWGKWIHLQAFFQVFMLQGFIMFVIASPILVTNLYHQNPPDWVWVVGLLIWLVGFFFEAVGDSQLRTFVKTKKPGDLMIKGLWKYTRHPNYFGESVM